MGFNSGFKELIRVCKSHFKQNWKSGWEIGYECLQIEVGAHENCALNLVLIAVKLLTHAGMGDECQ